MWVLEGALSECVPSVVNYNRRLGTVLRTCSRNPPLLYLASTETLSDPTDVCPSSVPALQFHLSPGPIKRTACPGPDNA
jgi:hypothetical protein